MWTAGVGVVTPLKCPIGYYCPVGTSNYQTFRCPVGKYADSAFVANAADPDEGMDGTEDCTEC